MLHAMLDQANLTDVVDLACRQNGKAVVTFGTYASLCQCINFFQGRQWGVIATYVRLVKTNQTPTAEDVPKQPAPIKGLSADAPVFVPGCFVASPRLDPSADKMCEGRQRAYSKASTKAGSADGTSDESVSDTGEQVLVTCT